MNNVHIRGCYCCFLLSTRIMNLSLYGKIHNGITWRCCAEKSLQTELFVSLHLSFSLSDVVFVASVVTGLTDAKQQPAAQSDQQLLIFLCSSLLWYSFMQLFWFDQTSYSAPDKTEPRVCSDAEIHRQTQTKYTTNHLIVSYS